jgi:hypothetical protein
MCTLTRTTFHYEEPYFIYVYIKLFVMAGDTTALHPGQTTAGNNQPNRSNNNSEIHTQGKLPCEVTISKQHALNHP